MNPLAPMLYHGGTGGLQISCRDAGILRGRIKQWERAMNKPRPNH
jgi:hypothetical protein